MIKTQGGYGLLLPCPFCGLDGEVFPVVDEDEDCVGFSGRCSAGCCESAMGKTRKDAIKTWNQRFAQPIYVNGLSQDSFQAFEKYIRDGYTVPIGKAISEGFGAATERFGLLTEEIVKMRQQLDSLEHQLTLTPKAQRRT
jgi:hypothetical protein